MSRALLITVSVGCHVALVLGLGELRVEKAVAATPITITEVAAPPKVKEIVKVEPPPVEPERAPEPRRAAKAAPVAEPVPDSAPAPAFDDVPDFGFALEGGVSSGGLAVAAPRQAAPAARRVVKQLVARAEPPKEDPCSDATTKPKPLSVPQPVYTDAARAAGVEGKVRVELTVDETGHVVDVKVLQGLGHGLDEAALSAARAASFSPAQRCGRAVRATFNIAMRFSAG